MSDDEPLRFKTVVKYLEVKRTRYWETLEQATQAISRFQLSCHDIGIPYEAELWEITADGKVLLDSVKEFSLGEKVIVAITRERTA